MKFFSEKSSSPQFDFVLSVFQECNPGKGEDAQYYSIRGRNAIASVFDGCGGSGSKVYESIGRKTGAYIASRAMSAATKKWYSSSNAEKDLHVNALKAIYDETLALCKSFDVSTSMLKSKMSLDFPTTASLVLCHPTERNLSADIIWAGDSRCYLLCDKGLMQLTRDDLAGRNHIEDYSADGVMNNVISASLPYVLNSMTLSIDTPCIVFAATDGCFAYYRTPMEFEYMLLDTLQRSNCVAEWEQCILDSLKDVAGDDFTLSGLAYGFNNFNTLKKAFSTRKNDLYSDYILPLKNADHEEVARLWRLYRDGYLQHMKGVH